MISAKKIIVAALFATMTTPAMAIGPIKKLFGGQKEFPITLQAQWQGIKRGSDPIELTIRDWKTGALLDKALLSPTQPSRNIQLKKFEGYALEARTLNGTIVTPLYFLKLPLTSHGGTIRVLHYTGVRGKSKLYLYGKLGQVRVHKTLLKPAWYKK
jgi:hypothetical protein